MSERGVRPPASVRAAFRRLWPGGRGEEVLEDLDGEYRKLEARHSRAVATGWYFLQLFRPGTWQLARALRRTRHAERARAEAGRGNRNNTVIGGLTLDMTLAWRMLLKSPWLTVVGVLGLALGTSVGIGFFVVASGFFYPKLPLEEGDRIIALENWDVEANRSERRSLHDFLAWREEMRSVEQIGAFSMGRRWLVTGDAAPQAVRAAEMTAAGFRVARVPALVGRYLEPDDEREGAPRVAVIGYELWQARFDGDPGIVGRTVLVSGSEHTLVGVMPPGFAFPQSQELWTVLRANPVEHARGEGPELFVFGRLAPGAVRAQAQAELSAIGMRAGTVFPETNARLRPQILPYTYPLENVHDVTLWEAAQVQLMVSLLLLAIAVNIAVLVYARTAMRRGEIAVRTALGASRRRIVSQLFIEALLLSALGAGLGLVAAHAALAQMQAIFDGMDGVAFWEDYSLQPRSVVCAVALAFLSAAIVGVVPGLKATGRRLDADLRRGSGASIRLGRAWTALIVVQVAVAITVLPSALHLGFREIRMGAMRTTFAAHEFLTADLGMAVPLRPGMDAEEYRRETAARFADRLPELERRLEAEPAVAGVTFEGNRLARGSLAEFETEPGLTESRAPLSVISTGVATDYFELLGARILAGRAFGAADLGESGTGVLVSEAFARRVPGGGPVLGRRVRLLTRHESGAGWDSIVPGRWLEIAGVVQDLQASAFDREVAPPAIFYAIDPGELQSAELLVRVRGGDTGEFAGPLRQITATLDPDLRLASVANLATMRNSRYLAVAVAVILVVLTTVLLLSAAGIHALMSLTVTQRRREIGIRTALGAHPRRLIAAIFARASWQLGLGGFLGTLLGGALLLGSGLPGRQAAIFLGGVVVLMVSAGLMAAAGPARRGLRMQPMESLREEHGATRRGVGPGPG